jgi:hypothetical protein
MMETLGCVVIQNGTFDLSNRQAIKNLCGGDSGGEGEPCKGIEAHETIGQWGSFNGCNRTEQVSWVFNKIYQSKRKDAAACVSLGGRVTSPAKADAQAADCSVLLKQVGPDAIGSVSFTPTPTGKSGGAGKNGNLSKGTQTGLEVGLTLFAVFLISLMAGFCIWSQKRKRRIAAMVQAEKTKTTEPVESDAAELPRNEVSEIEGKEKMELDAISPQTELDSEIRIELDGNDVGELPVSEIHEIGSSSPIKEKWEDKVIHGRDEKRDIKAP